MKTLRIVAIEDEADILDVLSVNLSAEGYEVLTATNGIAGLEMAKTQHPDLVLLDLLLPGLDGLEVCRQLRSHPETKHTPIIMLTCKSKETDKVIGLGIGADDYVTKPFGIDELVARVKAVLRRSQDREPAGAKARIQINGLVIDADRHEVIVDGQQVYLTATEFRLLHTLASFPGRVFTREHLIAQAISEDAEIIDRNIDVHVGAIRGKLGQYRRFIETVRGVGYRLMDYSK